MKELFFIRHGESEANKKDILASRQDFSLTAKGKNDLKIIADEFAAEYSLDTVITSPLVRARQSAEPFLEKFSLQPEEDERIIEQELGHYSGMTYSEIENEPEYEQRREKRWEWVPKGGGESYEMIANRLLPFFQDLSNHAGEKILIVTHAVCMRLVKAHLENTLPEYPSSLASNGEIWRVEFKNIGSEHKVESLYFGSSKENKSRA